MYQLKYKFNRRDQFHEFATIKDFAGYFLSVPDDEKNHILNNCDLLNQAIEQDMNFDLKALLIIGFDPRKRIKEGFKPVELAAITGRKNALAILYMLVDQEERELWKEQGVIKDHFGLMHGSATDAEAEEVARGAVARTASPPRRMSALSVSSERSWVQRTSSDEERLHCCQIM